MGQALAAEVALDDLPVQDEDDWLAFGYEPDLPDRNDTQLTATDSSVMVEMTVSVPVTD